MKRLVWLLGLVFILAACNLASTDDITPTAPLPTETPRESVLPEATLSGVQPTSIASLPTQPTNGSCPTPANWSTYTVAEGDTLSSIAQRAGSTIDEIAQGNCLTDVNLIEAGQTLNVPRLLSGNITVPTSAVGNTPNCTSLAGVAIGGTNTPTVAPAQPVSDGCYGIQANTAITVSWQPPISGLIEVTFYRNNSTLPRADVIGVDRDPSDGFSIIWNAFPEMPPSVIFARGNTSAQGSEIESGTIVIFVQ